MNTITYKCPNCDGGLVFDPKTQKFKCGYCLSEFTQEELEGLADTEEAENAEPAGPPKTVKLTEPAESVKSAEPADASNGDKPEASPLVVYHCPSCGAEIVTDETTAATFCYYCHNPVVLSGRLEGLYKPDYIIPFETDRKKAEEIFKNWVKRKRYVPGDFYSPKQIERMEGIYYPYWLYSCKVDGWIDAEGIKRRTTRTGSIEYLETSRYQVERKGEMDVKNISRNALKRADRRLSENVLPFDMEKRRPFQAAYLSGFKAERRDMEKDEFRQGIEAEVRDFAANSLKNSISSYDSVNIKSHREEIVSSEWNYTLLPVWVLTYRDKKSDKIYYFAMNGQSGKICGVLPVDYGKLAGLFAVIFFPVLILLLIGGYLI